MFKLNIHDMRVQKVYQFRDTSVTDCYLVDVPWDMFSRKCMPVKYLMTML